MGHALEVTPDVLIPRPETEVLVEASLEALRTMDLRSPRVLDIGTGSGNIAIAIGSRVPAAELWACDVSRAALNVARRNIDRHLPGRIELVEGDLFGENSGWGTFDLVVSNPPYVSLEDYGGLQPEIREFEPRVATTDEADGLRFLRRLCEQSCEWIRPGGVLCVEIAADQADAAIRAARAAGLEQEEILQDLSRLPRVLRCQRPRGSQP